MPQVLKELSNLSDRSQFLKNSDAVNSQNLYTTIANLKLRFLSDRLLQNFLKMSQEAGMESLAQELGVRAVTRLKSYNKEIQNLIDSVDRIEVVKSLGRGAIGFWPFSDSTNQVEQERSTGLDMLRAYFDEAKNYSGFKYQVFDDYLASVNAVVSDYPQFIGNLVSINSFSTSVSDAISRLKDLANKSKGEAPLQKLTQAVGGSGDTVNWSVAISEIVGNTASEVATKSVNALQQVGDTTLTAIENVGEGAKTLSTVVKYWPYILFIVGGVILYIYLPKPKRS